jgi:hypothetical protein
MAPGLYYALRWIPACSESWSGYQLQYRTRYQPTTEDDWSAEGGWTTYGSGLIDALSVTAFVMGSGSDAFQFRIRAVRLTGSTVVASSVWSSVVEG